MAKTQNKEERIIKRKQGWEFHFVELTVNNEHLTPKEDQSRGSVSCHLTNPIGKRESEMLADYDQLVASGLERQ